MKKLIPVLVFVLLGLAPELFAQKATKVPSKIGDALVLEFNAPFDRILIDADNSAFDDSENIFVSVGTNTKILDAQGKPLAAQMIRAGMKTEIKLEPTLDLTNLIASQIKVKTNAAAESVEVKGYLDKVTDEEAFIDGKTVLMMPNAAVVGTNEWKNKTFQSLKDVPLGSVVELKGARHAEDGKIYATQAQVKPNLITPTEKQLIALVQKGLVLPPADKPGAGVQIGSQTFKVADNLELNTYITKVGYKVIPRYLKTLQNGDPNKLLFRFYILEDDAPNAVALPDGSVFVTTGMLKRLDNEAQLAIILGHEIAHVSAEHARRELESAQKRAFWMGLAAAGASVALGQQAGGLIGQIGYGLLSNKFSRDLEDQADRIGLFYAYDSGYDIREATKIWRKLMGDNYRDNSVGTVLYSDHPSLKSRLRNTKRELVTDYQKADFREVVTGREKYMETVGIYFGWVKPKPKPQPVAAASTAKTTPVSSAANKTVKNKVPKSNPRTAARTGRTGKNGSDASRPRPARSSAGVVSTAASARGGSRPASIRAVNFRNFSYPVNRFCKDESQAGIAKVVNGKVVVGRDKDYGPHGFEVTKILYGDLTGDGAEEAVVSTVCGNLEPVSFNQSPIANTYVYTMEKGNLKLLSLFNESDLEADYKSYFNEETFLFAGGVERVAGNKLDYAVMALEGMCCPKWNVAMVLRWNGTGFVLAQKPTRTVWR